MNTHIVTKNLYTKFFLNRSKCLVVIAVTHKQKFFYPKVKKYCLLCWLIEYNILKFNNKKNITQQYCRVPPNRDGLGPVIRCQMLPWTSWGLGVFSVVISKIILWNELFGTISVLKSEQGDTKRTSLNNHVNEGLKVFNLLGHFEQTSSSFASHSSLVPSWSEVSAVLIVLLSKLLFQKGLSFKNTHNLVEITDEELLHNLH